MVEIQGKGLNQGIAMGNLCFDDRISHCKSPFILCTSGNISTSLISKHKSDILGLCVMGPAETSHAVIMAKGMGIPVIVGLIDMSVDFHGKKAIIDGYSGVVYIGPDEQATARLLAKRDEEASKQRDLQALIGKEAITADGRKIDILASIGRIGEISDVHTNDVSGIGLFRSEFLFADDREAPTEELQLGFYRHILEKMGSKSVIIRTFDIGGDKQVGFLSDEAEENPALGLRGIRFCLVHKELFVSQLRALYRASVYGNLKILLPMVNSVDEILQAKAIINQVKSDLEAEGVAFNNVPVGAMIETPAGAIASNLIADEVDFLSIGTNDLLQFTLAVDRCNANVSEYYDYRHPAFLRLLKLVVKNAHERGISVGICGEMAGNEDMVQKFIRLDIDYLSVTPNMVLPLRCRIRKLNTENLSE